MWFCSGYKKEFVIAQVVLGAAFLLLSLTSRIELLFVLSAAAGMRRASLCVVPFKLVNDIMHKEVCRLTFVSKFGHWDGKVK